MFLRRLFSIWIIISFLAGLVIPPQRAYAQDVLNLPQPGTMVSLSPAYTPVLIKGLKINPNNPLSLDFIVATGNSHLTAQDPELKKESEKLIKYFFAALTLPERDVWVNLSPYEKDRIVPKATGETEMGRDMLAQDYILKQITASLIYPENGLGKEFWSKVYAEASERFGTTQIPVNTFNKVWIVADKASVYEAKDTVFVVDAHLKVMLEEDYLALSKHVNGGVAEGGASPAARNEVRTDGETRGQDPDIHRLGSQIVREIVLPALEKEVNEGKNFANLRQIFHSLILAKWYKETLKTALLNQVYSNRDKIAGVGYKNSSPEAIYQQYLKAYKKGVFNYIKEDFDQTTQQPIPRKYFSGGVSAAMVIKMDTPDKFFKAEQEEGSRVPNEKFFNFSINAQPTSAAMLAPALIGSIGTAKVITADEVRRIVRIIYQAPGNVLIIGREDPLARKAYAHNQQQPFSTLSIFTKDGVRETRKWDPFRWSTFDPLWEKINNDEKYNIEIYQDSLKPGQYGLVILPSDAHHILDDNLMRSVRVIRKRYDQKIWFSLDVLNSDTKSVHATADVPLENPQAVVRFIQSYFREYNINVSVVKGSDREIKLNGKTLNVHSDDFDTEMEGSLQGVIKKSEAPRMLDVDDHLTFLGQEKTADFLIEELNPDNIEIRGPSGLSRGAIILKGYFRNNRLNIERGKFLWALMQATVIGFKNEIRIRQNKLQEIEIRNGESSPISLRDLSAKIRTWLIENKELLIFNAAMTSVFDRFYTIPSKIKPNFTEVLIDAQSKPLRSYLDLPLPDANSGLEAALNISITSTAEEYRVSFSLQKKGLLGIAVDKGRYKDISQGGKDFVKNSSGKALVKIEWNGKEAKISNVYPDADTDDVKVERRVLIKLSALKGMDMTVKLSSGEEERFPFNHQLVYSNNHQLANSINRQLMYLKLMEEGKILKIFKLGGIKFLLQEVTQGVLVKAEQNGEVSPGTQITVSATNAAMATPNIIHGTIKKPQFPQQLDARFLNRTSELIDNQLARHLSGKKIDSEDFMSFMRNENLMGAREQNVDADIGDNIMVVDYSGFYGEVVSQKEFVRILRMMAVQDMPLAMDFVQEYYKSLGPDAVKKFEGEQVIIQGLNSTDVLKQARALEAAAQQGNFDVNPTARKSMNFWYDPDAKVEQKIAAIQTAAVVLSQPELAKEFGDRPNKILHEGFKSVDFKEITAIAIAPLIFSKVPERSLSGIKKLDVIPVLIAILGNSQNPLRYKAAAIAIQNPDIAIRLNGRENEVIERVVARIKENRTLAPEALYLIRQLLRKMPKPHFPNIAKVFKFYSTDRTTLLNYVDERLGQKDPIAAAIVLEELSNAAMTAPVMSKEEVAKEVYKKLVEYSQSGHSVYFDWQDVYMYIKKWTPTETLVNKKIRRVERIMGILEEQGKVVREGQDIWRLPMTDNEELKIVQEIFRLGQGRRYWGGAVTKVVSPRKYGNVVNNPPNGKKGRIGLILTTQGNRVLFMNQTGFKQLILDAHRIIPGEVEKLLKDLQAALSNHAMKAVPQATGKRGGIDLDASKLKLQKTGSGVEIKFDTAMIERFKMGNFDGIVPVITSITPIASIYPLLGLKEPQANEKLAA